MFAVIDGPSNRSISVSAVDMLGRRCRVVVPFGRFSSPEALSGRFAGKLVAHPTDGALRTLAEAVLAAHLAAPSREPPLLSTAVARSPYGALLEPIASDIRVLELIAPRRPPSDSPAIRRVQVAVLRLRFDSATGLSRADLVGYRVTADLADPGGVRP
jgi:hypothetical protein